MLKIITASNPILSQSAKQIPKVSPSIVKLVGEMKKTLLSAKDPQGVGLAAPQIGKSLRLFIIKPTPASPFSVFINPRITTNKQQLTTNRLEVSGPASQRGEQKSAASKLEGCLSLPNIWGEVKRAPTIKLQYQLLTNNQKLITRTRAFSGFLATIIQHEFDHLQGILFPKKVLEQKGKLYKSRKDKKGEDIFEEIEI